MRLSATGGLVPSSAVRVRVQVPSSVQVTVVTAAAGVPKVQLAPASMPVPRRGPQEGRAVVGVGHGAREGDAAALGARGVGARVHDRRVVGQRADGRLAGAELGCVAGGLVGGRGGDDVTDRERHWEGEGAGGLSLEGAQELGALAVARRVAGGVAEELDAVRGAAAVERALDRAIQRRPRRS